MKLIQAQEKGLIFQGDAETAINLVNNLRWAYEHIDMPKIINDFVFNIEVALQNAGVIDEHFNRRDRKEDRHIQFKLEGKDYDLILRTDDQGKDFTSFDIFDYEAQEYKTGAKL